MKYTHLTRDERYQITILLKSSHTQREIAKLMSRSPSTISRELQRNRGHAATARSRRRRCQSHAGNPARIVRAYLLIPDTAIQLGRSLPALQAEFEWQG